MRRPNLIYKDREVLDINQARAQKTAVTKPHTKPNPGPEPSAIAVPQKKRKQKLDNGISQESNLPGPSAKKFKPGDFSELESNSRSKRSANKNNSLGSSLATPSTSTDIPPQPIQHASVSFDFDHGYFQSTVDESKIIHLRMDADGFERQFRVVGHDSRKQCVVRPSDLGIAHFHCILVLELVDDDQGPLVRRVLVMKSKLVTSEGTTIRVGGLTFPLGDTPVGLLPGSSIKFGSGPWFRYHGPQYQNLYKPLDPIREATNSSVSRIRRLHDGFVFVVKTIPKARSRMARTEMAAYKKLGHNPSILRAVESFLNKDTGIYHIVLEAASKDLKDFVDETRQDDQAGLHIAAPVWTKSVVAGVSHIHACGMAHRDLKPRNILVFIAEDGQVRLKVTDFGLARLSTESVIKGWRAGTPGWRAPASFRSHEDDRFADCYGVGRILHFILTNNQWPSESESDANRACGCDEACQGSCVRRNAEFKHLKENGIEKSCIRFLRDVLVGFPNQCMSIGEMRERSYLKRGSSGDCE